MITTIQITDIFRILLGSLTVALSLAFLSILLAPRLNLIDHPGSADHKLHKKPMPLTGGLVLVLTITSILFLAPGEIDRDIMSVVAASWIILTFGLWDDYHHLPAWGKLVGQLLAAVLLVFLDVKVRIFTSPEFIFGSETALGEGLNVLTTLVWMIVLTNAFNLIDSMDGLAAGLGALATLFFLVITLSVNQMELVHFCAIMIGAIAGIFFFLVRNKFFLPFIIILLFFFLITSFFKCGYSPITLPKFSHIPCTIFILSFLFFSGITFLILSNAFFEILSFGPINLAIVPNK